MSQPSRTIVVEPVQVSIKAPAPAESRVEPPAPERPAQAAARP